MPDEVYSQLSEIIERLELVAPGTKSALDKIDVTFMYDPKGYYHRWISDRDSEKDLHTRSGYYIPQKTLIFSRAGLKKSIVHEIIHAVDSGAGFTHPQYGEIPSSIALAYPEGRLDRRAPIISLVKPEWKFEPDPLRDVFLSAITMARVCQSNDTHRAQVVLFLAQGGWGYTETERSLKAIQANAFVTERMANLFEQFFSELSGDKLGYAGKKFYSAETQWTPEWLAENKGDLMALWTKMVEAVHNNPDASKKTDQATLIEEILGFEQ